MKNKKLEKLIIILAVIFVIGAVWFMFGNRISSGNIFVVDSADMTMPEANAITDEIKKNTIVDQTFKYNPDTISDIAIVFTRKYYLEGVRITIQLLDGSKVLAANTYKVEGIDDQHRTYLTPSSKITGVAGKELTLRIFSEDKADTGMAIMMQENKKNTFKFGKQEIQGTLCFSVSE